MLPTMASNVPKLVKSIPLHQPHVAGRFCSLYHLSLHHLHPKLSPIVSPSVCSTALSPSLSQPLSSFAQPSQSLPSDIKASDFFFLPLHKTNVHLASPHPNLLTPPTSSMNLPQSTAPQTNCPSTQPSPTFFSIRACSQLFSSTTFSNSTNSSPSTLILFSCP